MSEEEMQDILKDLASRGFNDDHLRSEIERMEALGLPAFSITRVKNFGDERMSYRLQFEWLESSLSYEFTAIGANHRMPVDIAKKMVNGINSIQLDRDMSVIDWAKYWDSRFKGEPADENFDMACCIDGIAQLLLHESSDVNLVAEQLMYKHWPPEIFALFSKDPERISKTFEQSYCFQKSTHPDITAELAYLIISERIDSLELQVEEFTAGLISVSDIRNEIHCKLKGSPSQTALNFSFVSGDAAIDLDIPVNRKDGWYHADTYRINSIQLPEIVQGIFNGVDSERLDKKMNTVDWKNDEDIIFLIDEDHIGHPKDIELMQEELFRMALDPEGKKAADILMLRHYLHVPFFEDLITSTAHGLLKGLPKSQAQFLAGMPLDKAVNLAAGRLVIVRDIQNSGHTTWQRMGFTADGNNGTLVGLFGISEAELEKMIAMLPVNMYDASEIEKALKNGDIVKVEAKTGIPITIMVSENADRITILDRKGKEIPFNFQLDPNWKPDKIQAQNLQDNVSKEGYKHQKVPTKIKESRSKGKGL